MLKLKDVQIEKRVPIPSKGEFNSLLRKLKIGDSFLMKGIKYDQATAHVCARQVGIKIATRRMKDGTLRVWRTK